MPTRQERIEILKARLGFLEQKEKNAERKRRTRRLILWGTIVEEMMEKDEELAKNTRQRAARRLTRKIDREASGLTVAGETGS
jgi:protein subunit release factor B